MKNGKQLARANGSLAIAALSAIALSAPAFGSTINSIETAYTGTNIPASTIGNTGGGDPTAVITYIASKPSTVDGYTYTNYALLTNDGTGSLDVFGKLPSGDTYVPTVGDGVTATGTYSPYQSIPEIESLTALSQTSTGNAVPGAITVTIPQLDTLASANPSNFGLQEYLLTLDNVTLSGPATFATHANTTLTATDGSSNTITIYQYASSYSTAAAFGGTAVPTGLVDITGIADVYTGGTPVTSTAEFIPFTITSVPEPTTLGLLGVGAAMLLRRRRTA